MADALLLRGDSQSALEWSGRAIQLFRSLAHRDPRNLRRSARRCSGHPSQDRAETLMRLGRHAEALADFEEVVELTQGSRAS